MKQSLEVGGSTGVGGPYPLLGSSDPPQLMRGYQSAGLNTETPQLGEEEVCALVREGGVPNIELHPLGPLIIEGAPRLDLERRGFARSLVEEEKVDAVVIGQGFIGGELALGGIHNGGGDHAFCDGS